MATENPLYHYHYQAIDELLVQFYDPKEMGNKLDEIMSELVIYANQNEDYREFLSDHHFILKLLRDIFWWKLPRTNHEVKV